MLGFGKDGVEAEPCTEFVEILEYKETAEEGLIAFFTDYGFLGFDLLQKFPFIGGDRSDEGIALGGDYFFEGVAIDGWVLFLEAAVEENEEVADVTTTDGAKPRNRRTARSPRRVWTADGEERTKSLVRTRWKDCCLYARGMSVRDIQAQLQEMYGVEVSPTLISNVTDEVIDEVKQWQNRPLNAVYPIVLSDRFRQT